MKYFLDFSVSLIALILFSPVLLIVTTLVRLKLGSPIFFTQDRPGINGKVFTIYKFRTMKDVLDKAGHTLSDDERLTSFGRLLRSTSLDEMPALWNVLKGEMSLVGPRPLLTEYLPLYSKEQNKRHNVLPGITGWAQINGRNAISWEEKFKLDIWYVDNQNFWLDFKILLLTVKKVFVREGISAKGEATMTRFTGTKLD